jgi:hypothetical protein
MVDYTYYTGTYHGSYFKNQNDFLRNESIAVQILSKYYQIPEVLTDNIKKCVCALSETVDKRENAIKAQQNGISSESVSGYSVSYSSAVSIKYNYNKEILDIIDLWIGSAANTCRGVGRHVY